jgi:hypothetical protein
LTIKKGAVKVPRPKIGSVGGMLAGSEPKEHHREIGQPRLLAKDSGTGGKVHFADLFCHTRIESGPPPPAQARQFAAARVINSRLQYSKCLKTRPLTPAAPAT